MSARNSAFPLLRCLALYRATPWRFLLTSLLFVILNLSLVYQQWLIGRAVHDVERGAAVVRLPDGGLDFGVAWHWLLVLVAVALGRGVVQYLAGVSALIIGQSLLFNLRERILVQVQRLDLAYHWQHGVGELVTRTTRDADKVRDALINFWRQVFETGLVVIAAVGLLVWYDPWLGLVPLLLTLTGLAIFVRQTDRLVALDRATGAAYDAVNQDLSEGVNGVRVIKAFALEPRRIERFNTHVLHFAGQAKAALAYSCRSIPIPQMVIALGHVWILGFGAQLVAAGRLNLGELVAALLLANTLVFRVEGIGRVMQVFADARSSAQRIWELLDERPRIAGGGAHPPAGALGVRLRDVQVAAPGGSNSILQDCSLQIRPGEVVALVGATGSGKSTLAGLLPRLFDADRGAVEIGTDARGWRDVRELDLGALRRQVHVVPQESFLFSDSVAANLRQAAPDASEDELRAALRLACAEEVVDGLREGFDARLGDRGITLSGGQRQRLCLARALLARPGLLVLDDATSALDAVTERTVLGNVRRLGEARGEARPTVLLIASKLSTVLLADRVLMLAGGRIAADGSHEELAAALPAYRDLLGVDHG
ncbi:ABC transporter ATP-binding protein [Thauera sinica]|uniref:ABC transporter ATP-binding protein n=1 Tax=Thauera sinica TaxID=2665146 RepID=A0ABW1AM44_9RHOO|nr:ABC transporter ATP-binding protein [Thauera sp. K11]ATE59176.1 ABC transporter ATP-binding protein [Thauera sp. K11]